MAVEMVVKMAVEKTAQMTVDMSGRGVARGVRLVGGSPVDVVCVTYQISYPYGGTINFETCIEMQLRNHEPPI